MTAPLGIAGARSGRQDANAVYGIAVGCFVSLPFWVGIGALLRAALG